MLSVLPGHASIMNKVVSNFWSRLSHHSSHLSSPKISVEARMSEALATLATLIGRESDKSTDPLCSLSFSCLSPDVVKVQSELLEYFKKDCHRAFSPLNPLGKPLRKFSERESEHWFSAESHGLSIIKPSFLLRPGKRSERLEKKISRPDFSTPSSPHDNLSIISATESITLKSSAPKTLTK